MKPNPVLKKLGYSDTDKLVIIHTDDIGMCQASVQAFADLWEFGTISSGAVMVPCPWFPEAAAFCRAHPEVDMGLHSTLTAEWDNYRWAPISTVDRATGLFDKEGFFHSRAAPVHAQANVNAVEAEIQAQFDRAVQFGIDPTHIDTHMLTAWHPKLLPAYMSPARKSRVPFMLPRNLATSSMSMGADSSALNDLSNLLDQLENEGQPLVDRFAEIPLDDPVDQVNVTKKILRELEPGITYLVLHPSIDTPELRAICPDWPSRVANYEAMMSKEIKDFIKNEGVQLIGYKPLRELLRS